MADEVEPRYESPEPPLKEMYGAYFLEYASYVILDRAVPYVEDGLKPVQRRILHAMYELDDGRFNKVANLIGATMQFHPHGDASIGDALVGMGQKNLLIDTQGNWGNVETGDGAAAPRYIEARLSKFALEVVFNPKTTAWQASYDGRKQEPIALPVKFPLLLALGVEGIAVGLSTKILPHNFCELIEAAVRYLEGKPFELFPDFLTGGMVDVSAYNAGGRGGKVRCRAHIKELDKKTLAITDVPYGVTTQTLIESIVKANERGKIKVKKIEDNTARDVEILVHLAPGTSPDVTIDALYAFTDCEVAISPNCVVIENERPLITDVHHVLRLSVDRTQALLAQELEIRLRELEDAWHFSSLEKIFIENRIYRDIEEAETWEAVLANIDAGLGPFKPLFQRPIVEADILRLTEIRIKRISRYDSFQADEHIRGLEAEMEEVKNHLAHLTAYTIRYYKELLKKYGKGRERRTELRTFDTIQAQVVAVANQKLYVNRAEGFVGYGLKKDEYVTDCSDLDEIIVFREDGSMLVSKVAEKTFVGKGILHVEVFRRNDERTVYHLIYQDGVAGPALVKRFQAGGVTRDKPYDLTKGTKGSRVLYFSAHPNGESEVVAVQLKPMPRLRNTTLEFDFGQLAIKGRAAGGNILTRHPVKKVVRKSVGASTLGGRQLWFDPALGRLNADGHGDYLGVFEGEDRLLALYDTGVYEITTHELSNRYDVKGKLLDIAKLTPDTLVGCVYYEGEKKDYYAKRFKIETQTLDKGVPFVPETPGTKVLFATLKPEPVVALTTVGKKGEKPSQQPPAPLADLADVTGYRALGKRLAAESIKAVALTSYQAPAPEPDEQPLADDPDATPADDQGTLF
ncbi:MAG: DNA gyrase/topoisomerase IV subunit A [Bacteroidia bacterium]|nr:DNA gyrase/topoisomerase IV subunit A [Bacteroidia bacterium]